MDPPLEVSGGQKQYYVNGLILWNGPPRGIWWSRAVLCGMDPPSQHRKTKWSGLFCNGTGKQLLVFHRKDLCEAKHKT